MRSWLSDVREHADPHLTCILVANKIDLCSGPSPSKPRVVSTEEAAQWAKEEEMDYLEASAKTGVNVDEAFTRAARIILSKIKTGLFDDKRSTGVKKPTHSSVNQLTLETTPSKGNCC
ncbi:hypothetical protein FRB98_007138 [Tulasnella sp. 332]|nr:hypothetical protein FRB98_007138 [Tulasnella sp. 332]